MTRYKLVTSAALLLLPVATFSAGLPWYAGVSGGASSLRPETQNSPFTLDSSVSVGGGAFVGYDVSKRLSIELGYNYLGRATLQGANGKTDIGYSALSAGALLYLYGDADDLAARNGFASYLRLGVNSMSNSASIPLDREEDIAIWSGLGVEWPITYNMSLRGELSSFDGDAQTARLSVMYRPRSVVATVPEARAQQPQAPVERPPSQEITTVEAIPAPELAPVPEVASVPEVAPVPEVASVPEAAPVPEVASVPEIPTAPEPKILPAPIIKPPVVELPSIKPEQPSTVVALNDCVESTTSEPVDAQGCALFSGVLSGVEFASGTAILNPTSAEYLDQLSDNILLNPSIVIEIQAHTESFNNIARAKDVARQRTIAVARYLVGNGVPVKQLRARAFGHSRPLVSDATVSGRQQNNRIELRVLP